MYKPGRRHESGRHIESFEGGATRPSRTRRCHGGRGFIPEAPYRILQNTGRPTAPYRRRHYQAALRRGRHIQAEALVVGLQLPHPERRRHTGNPNENLPFVFLGVGGLRQRHLHDHLAGGAPQLSRHQIIPVPPEGSVHCGRGGAELGSQVDRR